MTGDQVLSVLPEKMPEIAAEERLALALDAAQLGFWSWNPETDLVEFSDRANQIFGISTGVWMTWPQMQLLIEGDGREWARTRVAEAIETGSFYDVEYVVRRPIDGRRVWIHARGRAVYDARGILRAMFGVVADITERKRVEEQLIAERERFASLDRVQSFMLALTDTLRGIADPLQVLHEASKLLGTRLTAGRVGYAEIDATGRFATVERDWTDGTMPSVVGKYELDSFGPTIIEEMRRGQPIAVSDVHTDARTSDPQSIAAFAAIGVRSAIAVPLIRNGHFGALLFIHHSAPRLWHESERAIVAQMAERTWAEVERARAEMALRESEIRFRTMADSAPAPVWVTNQAGGIAFVNQAFVDYAGMNREQLLGDTWISLIHPADIGAVAGRRAEAWARGHEPYVFEARVRRRDGEWRWLRASSKPRHDAGGAFLGYVGLAVDITDTLLAQQELQESAERLRIAQEAGGVGTFEWFVGSDRLVGSGAFNRLYDVPGDAPTTGALLLERVHADDRHLLSKLPGRSIEEVFRYVEFRIVLPSGDTRWVARRGEVKRDSAGHAVKVLGVSYDVTDRKLAEERLRELAATLEERVAERTAERDRLWALSEDLLVTLDAQGQFLRTSPSWTRLLGIDEQALMRSPYPALLHPDDRGAVIEQLRHMKHTRKPVRFEVRMRAGDGSWRYIAWTVSPEPDGERSHGVGRDVTAEREAAAELQRAQDALRQAQKMEAIGQMTGGLAHDFNNLLTVVIGSLQLIETVPQEVMKVQKLAASGLAAAERASRLTQQLLAFARRQTLRPERVDPNQIIRDFLPLIRQAAGGSVEVSLDLANDLGACELDAAQFQSAILNLVVNSRDALPAGGRITISSRRLDAGTDGGVADLKSGPHLKLAVADNGHGMSAETVARAFDPFFTTKSVGQGSGLGLSMVYGFAKQSGGDVVIQSTEGQGTTVTLILPLCEALQHIA